MILFLNSVIALLLGAITYFIVGRFASGDMPIIIAIWVSMISASLLSALRRIRRK